MSKSGKAALSSLVFLFLFQLSEFLICYGFNDKFWYLVGFISITILPPLGLYMVSLITKKDLFVKFYTFLAFICVSILFFINGAIEGASCPGNYVIFRGFSDELIYFYEIFYYSGLIFVILEIMRAKRIFAGEPLKIKFLNWFLLGYLSFMIPTSILILIPPFNLSAIPSVLCGFAVIFAFILTIKIVPIAKKLNI